MLKQYLSCLLCCLLLVSFNVTFLSAQTQADETDSSTAKVKAAVLKRGTGEKKRVKVKLQDGTKLKGYIGRADADSFTLVEAKTGQSRSLAYRDVAKISNRSSKGEKVALWILAGAAAVTAVVLLGIVYVRCENEGGC